MRLDFEYAQRIPTNVLPALPISEWVAIIEATAVKHSLDPIRGKKALLYAVEHGGVGAAGISVWAALGGLC